MATLDKYLGRLRDLKIRFAVGALENPGELSASNMGYLKGRYDGLKEAEKLLNEVLNEEKGKKDE